MDIPLYLIALLASGALLIPSYDLFFKDRDNRRLAAYTSLTLLLISIVVVIVPYILPSVGLTSSTSLFRTDFLGIFFSVAVLLVTTLVVMSSIDYQRDDPNATVYYSLLLFFVSDKRKPAKIAVESIEEPP